MGKDYNIYIKIELSRDKSTGILNLITHFNLDAPNVMVGKDGYIWFPTEEEKDLISDSFELMPDEKSSPSLSKIEISGTQKPDENQKTPFQNNQQKTPQPEPVKTPQPQPIQTNSAEQKPPTPKPEIKQNQPPENSPFQGKTQPEIKKPEIQTIAEPNKAENQTPEIQTNTEPSLKEEETKWKEEEEQRLKELKQEEGLPPLEVNSDEGSSFELTANDFPENEPEDKKKENKQPDINIKEEDKTEEKQENKKEEDEGMIVKADEDAIERALKKHTGDKDESMVEADEKTIIDKVLKQKKKWKKED